MKADLEKAKEVASSGNDPSRRSKSDDGSGGGGKDESDARISSSTRHSTTPRDDATSGDDGTAKRSGTTGGGRRARPERAIYQPGALRGGKKGGAGREDVEAREGREAYSPVNVAGVTKGSGDDKESCV